MKIPLFDIDSTLLEGGNKAHAGAFDFAFQTVYHIPGKYNDVVSQGKIDNQILLEIAELYGIPQDKTKEKLPEATKAMLTYFLEHQENSHPVVLPGVKKLLQTLQQKNSPVGVLTGNVEGIGWKKLEKAGIKKYIGFGAFGNLAFKRPDLIPIAQQRARDLYKKDFPPYDFVIIGDTPLDIACAKQGEILSIGVATGLYSFDDLIKAGADLVVKSLEAKDEILAFLEDK